MKKVLLVMMTAMLSLSTAFAQKVTLDFTKAADDWKMPTSNTKEAASYTNGKNTITMVVGSVGNGWKASSGYVIFGQTGYGIQLPEFDFPVSKIEVVGKSDASSAVKFNVFVGSDAVSEEVTGATGTQTFIIASDAQKAGTIYVIKNNSKHNNQVTFIKIYEAGAGTSDPVFSVKGGTFIEAQSVALSTTTEGADIYYTLDGTEPTKESTKYTEALTISATTTIKAIAIKDEEASKVVSATYTIVSVEGGGTKKNPYTVTEVKLMNNGLGTANKYWVKGIVAGYYSNNKVIAGVVDAVNSNLALAVGTDTIPVELPSSIRKTLNLKDFPEMLGKEIYVYGTLQAYFNVPGVKSTADWIDPTQPQYHYLVGTVTEGAWDVAKSVQMTNDTIVLDLKAGDWAFKVLSNNTTFVNALTAKDVNIEDSSKGLVAGTGNSNINFTLVRDGKVTIAVVNDSVVLTGAFGPVLEGVYYVQNVASGKFLTRGATWGTQAITSDYGMAWDLTSADAKYTLRMTDIVAAGSKSGLGDNGYSDNGSPISFEITKDENSNLVFPFSPTEANDLNMSAASAWRLISPAVYADTLAARTDAQNAKVAAAAGINDNLVKALANTEVWASKAIDAIPFPSKSKWTAYTNARGGNLNEGSYGVEAYQTGDASFTTKVEGLAAGIYKVTVNAMQRSTSNAACWAVKDKAPDNSGAYFVANGSSVNLKSWASGATADNNPNSPAAMIDLTKSGQYTSELYVYVGEDGVLNLKAASPGWWNSCWFVFTGCSLTYYTDKVSEEEAAALLASIPTVPYDRDLSEAVQAAKKDFEEAKTIANYNALQKTLNDAKACVEKYTEAKALLEAAMGFDADGQVVYNAAEAVVAFQQNYKDTAIVEITAEVKAALQSALVAAAKAQTTYGSDMTVALTGNNGSIDGWVRTFTAGGTNGSFEVNTWSNEGETDGSEVKTPFVQTWVGRPTALSPMTIVNKVEGLKSGKYTINLQARAYREAGGEVKGISVFAGKDTVEMTTGTEIAGKGIYGYYDVTAQVAQDGGSIEYGFVVTDSCTANWLSFKNCTLTLVGEADDPNDLGWIIRDAVAANAADAKIEINLEAEKEYTFKQSAETSIGAVIVNGNGAKVVVAEGAQFVAKNNLQLKNLVLDCNAATVALVSMAKVATAADTAALYSKVMVEGEWKNRLAGESLNQTSFYADTLSIDGCEIQGLGASLISDGTKLPWALSTLIVNNSVVEFNYASGRPVIDFNKSGKSIKDIVITNSTLYNDEYTTGMYFIQFNNKSNATPRKVWGADAEGNNVVATWTMTNNTIVNLPSNTNFANNYHDSKTDCTLDWKSNIFANVSLLQKVGRNSTRTFVADDNVICAGAKETVDATDASTFATVDTIMAVSVKEGVKNFSPDKYSYAAKMQMGDPRWLIGVEYVNAADTLQGYINKAIALLTAEDAATTIEAYSKLSEEKGRAVTIVGGNSIEDMIGEIIALKYAIIDYEKAERTGIETISMEAQSATLYNLAGQRVSKASGIVIMNGKKVLVK